MKNGYYQDGYLINEILIKNYLVFKLITQIYI